MACRGGRRRGGFVGRLLLALLLVQAAWASQEEEEEEEEEVLSQVAFVQRTRTSERGPGEFMFEFDDDEIFHVDLARQQAVWRLEEFGNFTSFEAQGALANIATLRFNLDIMMNRTNNTPAENVPPKLTVYTENAMELGVPNVLICSVDKFSPPVLNISWWKNGHKLDETSQITETDYYPNKDNSFRKFSYLIFIPSMEDTYFCQVEHWSLKQPLSRQWDGKVLQPLSETRENVACGLGLAVGIVGIVTGTALIIKSRQQNRANYPRGAL